MVAKVQVPWFDGEINQAVEGTGGLRISEVISNKWYSKITAEELTGKWNIGIETARSTLKVTTQHGFRHAIERYRTDILQSWLRLRSSTIFTDTLFGTVKSIQGNLCGQILTDGRLAHFVPMKSKSKAGNLLANSTHEVDVPNRIIFDGANEQVDPNTEYMKYVRRDHIDWRSTEPYSLWQNKAIGMIREIRKDWRRARIKIIFPEDYGTTGWCMPAH